MHATESGSFNFYSMFHSTTTKSTSEFCLLRVIESMDDQISPNLCRLCMAETSNGVEIFRKRASEYSTYSQIIMATFQVQVGLNTMPCTFLFA